AGDVNGDGAVDVVTGDDSSITVQLGDGAGGFVPSQIYAAVGRPVILGDFDHDGTLDLATSSANLLRGAGNGAFSNAETFAALGGDFRAAGDFNHDGWLDLATNTAILLNDQSWPPPPPSTPSLRINDVTVTEGNSGTVAATFTVTLSAAATQ